MDRNGLAVLTLRVGILERSHELSEGAFSDGAVLEADVLVSCSILDLGELGGLRRQETLLVDGRGAIWDAEPYVHICGI